MALPNSAFSDIITTTLQGYSGELADNITNHNALFRQIAKKGNLQMATGRSIVQEIEYAQNTTTMWYSGAETLDISPSDTFTAAEFAYKQLAGHVVVNGLEEIQNTGSEAVHNLVRARVRNLDKSLRNTVATALYADGTGTDGKEFGGLRLLVADTNTNTVGGISANTNAWWRNYVYDFSANSASASVASIQHAMNTTWLNVIRGSDKPDIIPADANYYMLYWESLTPNQRFVDDTKAGSGFTNLVYQADVPVVFDDQCPSNHMYFLNTDYLFVRKTKRWFTPLGDKSSVNQDAIVMPVVLAGNMTTSNRSLQGVLID